jgi:hypothetical protein
LTARKTLSREISGEGSAIERDLRCKCTMRHAAAWRRARSMAGI